VRFARQDITDPEVIKRVNHCLSELTAAERIDLAPENIVALPHNQKELADALAKELREIRHGLEWFTSKEELETLAAKSAEVQHNIGRQWLRTRLVDMSDEEKGKVKQKVEELLEG
jgi:hypothetical protein